MQRVDHEKKAFELKPFIKPRSLNATPNLTTGRTKSIDSDSLTIASATKKQADEYYKALDKKQSSYPQDAVIFGKPSVLLNKQEVKDGTYLNKSLNQFTAQQLVELAEKYNSGSNGQSSVMKDILDQLE